MNNKQFFAFLSLCLISYSLFSQAAGNLNYRNAYVTPELKGNASFISNNEVLIDINALANLKADSYVVLFGVTQFGKSAEEAERQIDERIGRIKQSIDAALSVYVDMVSFIPVYEFEESKKVFSPRTYVEVPKGFEIRKNIHVEFEQPEYLDRLITICAQNEVYDLVRVDYQSSLVTTYLDSLRTMCLDLVQQRIGDYEKLGLRFSKRARLITEDNNIYFPIDRYDQYEVYKSVAPDFKSKSKIQKQPKQNTLFYNPISYKGYDIILNPKIVEPVLQLAYNVKMRIFLEEVPAIRPDRELMIMMPNGALQRVRLPAENEEEEGEENN
ncbi:MAG: SIMPL domain-containing protein [Bacteroidota bacterium]